MPGRLQAWGALEGAGIRVDTHCCPGYLVPPYYDSLLAKVIVRMSEALRRLEVAGVPTTTPFHREVIAHDDFKAGRITTRWVGEKFLASAVAAQAMQ